MKCAYCRGDHANAEELQKCGDRFWASWDAEQQREREIDAYMKHLNEVERESFDESR